MATIIDPPNSVWPNGLKVDSEGYVTFYPLGTNKVDISTITWPDGDKLVSPFVYQNDKLVGFVDTKALTVSGSATTTMNYSHIEADFSSIVEGTLTVDAPNAIVKKFRWSVVDSGDDNDIVTIKYKGCKTVNDIAVVNPDYKTTDIVDGVWSEGLGDLERGCFEASNDSGMFKNCSNLVSFTSDLSSLTFGSHMFVYCTNLTSFNAELPSLTNGYAMFMGCSNLTSFNSDLPNLTNGSDMFDNCDSLTSFSSNLSSLTIGSHMFSNNPNFTTFSAGLPNLADGYGMFYNNTNFTTFSSDLPSLTDGYSMFNNCKLDAPSVKNIISTINIPYNAQTSPQITLGMGCNDTSEDKDLFAQEAGYADMSSLLNALQTKYWTVAAQYNGRPTTAYGLRRPSENTLPVFVKLEETEKHADYISEDGSKKFKLDWFHETTGSAEGYTQFASLEEAIETLNIKPIERN